MKLNKKNILIIILLIPAVLFFHNFILGPLFSVNSTKLDSKSKVMRYLKKNYKNESFIIKDNPSIKKNSKCGSNDEYTWTVSSTNSGIEFDVISSYKYDGAFVCQKNNYDTYKVKVVDSFISNRGGIIISKNGYGDISFDQNGASDEYFIENVYDTISNLKKEYPFKDNNVSVNVSITMENGTKAYLKLKDITSLSYLKSIINK